MSFLRVHELKKAYSGKPVLDIPELTIQKGSVTAIIGTNGAGKSTLLHIIDGILKPDCGKVSYDGAEHSASVTYSIRTARTKAHIFQKPVMFNSNVFSNIAYGLKVRGTKKAEIKRKVAGIADLLDLTELLGQNAVTLSGGETSRTALARALVLEPQLLLMDEPTANLDPKNVKLIESTITKISRGSGTTILMVTHNMHQAQRLADTVVLLIDGEIAAQGNVAEFFENPGSEKAENFITGKMIY